QSELRPLRGLEIDLEADPVPFEHKADHPASTREAVDVADRQNGSLLHRLEQLVDSGALRVADERDVAPAEHLVAGIAFDADRVTLGGLPFDPLECWPEPVRADDTQHQRCRLTLERGGGPIGESGEVEQERRLDSILPGVLTLDRRRESQQPTDEDRHDPAERRRRLATWQLHGQPSGGSEPQRDLGVALALDLGRHRTSVWADEFQMARMGEISTYQGKLDTPGRAPTEAGIQFDVVADAELSKRADGPRSEVQFDFSTNVDRRSHVALVLRTSPLVKRRIAEARAARPLTCVDREEAVRRAQTPPIHRFDVQHGLDPGSLSVERVVAPDRDRQVGNRLGRQRGRQQLAESESMIDVVEGGDIDRCLWRYTPAVANLVRSERLRAEAGIASVLQQRREGNKT